MIENVNDFLSVAVLSIFLLGALYSGLRALNNRRIRKHIEEEFNYYNDDEDEE